MCTKENLPCLPPLTWVLLLYILVGSHTFLLETHYRVDYFMLLYDELVNVCLSPRPQAAE